MKRILSLVITLAMMLSGTVAFADGLPKPTAGSQISQAVPLNTKFVKQNVKVQDGTFKSVSITVTSVEDVTKNMKAIYKSAGYEVTTLKDPAKLNKVAITMTATGFTGNKTGYIDSNLPIYNLKTYTEDGTNYAGTVLMKDFSNSLYANASYLPKKGAYYMKKFSQVKDTTFTYKGYAYVMSSAKGTYPVLEVDFGYRNDDANRNAYFLMTKPTNYPKFTGENIVAVSDEVVTFETLIPLSVKDDPILGSGYEIANEYVSENGAIDINIGRMKYNETNNFDAFKASLKEQLLSSYNVEVLEETANLLTVKCVGQTYCYIKVANTPNGFVFASFETLSPLYQKYIDDTFQVLRIR